VNPEQQRIAQVDEKLTILRESWIDSKPETRSTWMTKIDDALDERSKLMKVRDGNHAAWKEARSES
jgi:hypothetical protein